MRLTAVCMSLGILALVLGGCSLSATPAATQPSGVTQQLLVRSLERALAKVDLERLKQQTVAVEVFPHAGPDTFVREFTISWLRARGVRTVSAVTESPDVKLKAFASAFGTDTDSTLIGIPAFEAPVVNMPIPEIALFKWQRNRGVAEMRLYEFDGKTDLVLNAPPPSIGRAKFDKFTVLLIIGFTVTDVEKYD
jgi:hypothetical protein